MKKILTQNRRLFLYGLVSHWIPDGAKFNRFRNGFLRWAGVEIGNGTVISSRAYFYGNGKIIIGSGCIIEGGVIFHSCGLGCIRLGENVHIAWGVNIEASGLLEIGSQTHVMQNSLLASNCGSHLKIGENCQIAHMVSLKTGTHQIDPNGKCIAGKSEFKDIIIGDGCWIAACVTVIPGVTVSHRSILAAGAVVIRDVGPGELVAGCPAVVKKTYFS